MQRSCSISLTGCPGVDSPITNISAEAPDPFTFWGQIWNPYNPYRPIPLNPDEYVKTDCDDLFHLFFSVYDPIVYAGTQLQANQQALAAQLGCTWPEPTPGQIYENDAQTATVYCADGSAFTYTVDAGTLVSPELDAILGAAWLTAANAWAANYALEQASALRACVVNEPGAGDLPTGSPGDNPPTPTTPPSGGLIPNVVWLCKDDELYRTYNVSGSDLTPFTLSIVEGSIPTGTLFSQTGPRKAVVSGFPSVPGEYQFKIRAVSVSAPLITSEVWAAIFVFGITNPSLPNGQLATAYSEVLSAAGGTAPYTFELAPGSDPLPDGLTLASDGTISGTPTVEDTFSFTVTVNDSNGGRCDEDITIAVVPVECSGVVTAIPNLVWAISAVGTGSYSASMAGGSGAFSYAAPAETPVVHNIYFDSEFCNPTDDAIRLRVEVNYVSFGALHVPPSTIGRIFILVNGAPGTVSSEANFLLDTPNPIWGENTVPAHSSVTLRIGIFTSVWSATPAFNWNNTTPISLTVIP